MSKKPKRTASPDQWRANRSASMLESEFGAHSSPLKQKKGFHASSIVGKRAEDRILKRVANDVKAEAHEFQDYSRHMSPDKNSKSVNLGDSFGTDLRDGSRQGSRQGSRGGPRPRSPEMLEPIVPVEEVNEQDMMDKRLFQYRVDKIPNARLGYEVPIADQTRVLGSSQFLGCPGDFCNFDMGYLEDPEVSGVEEAVGSGQTLSEFRKKLLATGSNNDFIQRDSVMSKILHEGGHSKSAPNLQEPVTGVNAGGTSGPFAETPMKITYRSIIQARQQMPQVKMQLERHRKGEDIPYVREETYEDFSVAGKLPAHYYQEVPCCMNCYKVYTIVDTARSKALATVQRKKDRGIDAKAEAEEEAERHNRDISFTTQKDRTTGKETRVIQGLTSHQINALQNLGVGAERDRRRSAHAGYDIINASQASVEADQEEEQRKQETLRAAITSIDGLTKMDVAEIRTMAKPHAAVEVVMEAVMAVLTGRIMTFKETHKLLGSGEFFLTMLKDFDINDVTDARLKLVEGYTDNPLFRPENVQPISFCASKFCAWVHGIVHAARYQRGYTHERLDIIKPAPQQPPQIRSDHHYLKPLRRTPAPTAFNRGEGGVGGSVGGGRALPVGAYLIGGDGDEEGSFVQRLEKIKANRQRTGSSNGGGGPSGLLSRQGGDMTGSQAHRKAVLAQSNKPSLRSVSRSQELDSKYSNSLAQGSQISANSHLIAPSVSKFDPGPIPPLSGATGTVSVGGGTSGGGKKMTKRESKAMLAMQKKAAERLSAPSVAESGVSLLGNPKEFRCADGITKMPYMVLGHISLNVQKCSFIVIHDFFDTCDATSILYKPIVQRHDGCQVLTFNYPGQANTVWPRLSKAEKSHGAKEPILNNDWIADRLNELLRYAEAQGDILLSNPFHLVGIGNGACIAAAFCQRWGRDRAYATGLRSVVSVNGFLYPDPQLSSILHAAYQVFESTPHTRPDIPVSYWGRFVFSDEYLSKINPNLALNIYTAVSNPITNDGRARITRGCLQHRDMRGALAPDYKPVRSTSSNQNQYLPIQVPVIVLQSTENSLVNASNVDSFLQGRNCKHLWSHMLNMPSEAMQFHALGGVDTTAHWVGKMSQSSEDYHKYSTLGRTGLKMILDSLRSPRGAFSMWTRTGHIVAQEYKAAFLDLMDVLACPTDDYVGLDAIEVAEEQRKALLAMTGGKLQDEEPPAPKVDVLFGLENSPSKGMEEEDDSAKEVARDPSIVDEYAGEVLNVENAVQDMLDNIGYTKPFVEGSESVAQENTTTTSPQPPNPQPIHIQKDPSDKNLNIDGKDEDDDQEILAITNAPKTILGSDLEQDSLEREPPPRMMSVSSSSFKADPDSDAMALANSVPATPPEAASKHDAHLISRSPTLQLENAPSKYNEEPQPVNLGELYALSRPDLPADENIIRSPPATAEPVVPYSPARTADYMPMDHSIVDSDRTGTKLITSLKDGVESSFISSTTQKHDKEWTTMVPDAATALELEAELRQKQQEYLALEARLKEMNEQSERDRHSRFDQAQQDRREEYSKQDQDLLGKLQADIDSRQRERDFAEKQRRIEMKAVNDALVAKGMIPPSGEEDFYGSSSSIIQEPVQEIVPMHYEDPPQLPKALQEGLDVISKLDAMKADEEAARKQGTLSIEDYEKVKREMAERQMARDNMLRALSNEEKEELFEACAVKIQMVGRGYLGRQRFAGELERRKLALLKVKKTILIQSVMRGHLGRRRFNRIKDLYLNNIKNAYSAQQIQRMFRGHKDRKYFRRLHRWVSAIKAQRVFRGHLGRSAFKREQQRLEGLRKKEVAAGKLQSVWRMKVAKEEFRSLRIHVLACIEIQRLYRGYLGRKQMARKRQWESTAPGPERIKLGLEFIEESKQAFERQQEEIDALHRAQERAEARVSHIHAELTESEKELVILERELQEIDQIERDLNVLTQEKDLLTQGIEDAAGMPRVAGKGHKELVMGHESHKENDPIHDRRRKAEAYALEMTIQIKRAEREKKRQELEIEFAAVFQEVEKKKKALERLELSLNDMETTRERKDREFRRLQKNLMQLLMEQKQELDELREKGIELETATATTAAAAVATAQKAKEHEARSTAMFSQTEELMKFQFMSMSLSYFSSLNMLKSLRDMNADTTSAAITLSADASATAAGAAAAANLPNMKKLNLGANDFIEGHIHQKKAELQISQDAEKEYKAAVNNPIPDNVRSWTVSDVARWLDGLSLGQYISSFTEGSVDGPFLMELREEDLVQVLGIRHKLHVRKILLSREKLKPLTLQELRNKEIVETEIKADASRAEQGVPSLDTVFSQARNGRIKRVEESLNLGFPIDSEDEKGNTLLLVSCQNSNRRLVEMLLIRGANINHQNAHGNTALHFALTFDQEGTLGEYLIEHGADDTIENVEGLTAYDGVSAH